MVKTNVEMIIEYLGGQSNIKDFTIGHSNVVLFELNEITNANLVAVQDTREVIEVIQQGNTVTLHYQDGLTGIFTETLAQNPVEEPEEEVGENKNVMTKVMDALQGIFAPILAPLAGAGILQGITILLTTLELIPVGNAEEGLLLLISDAVFYFMPILLAFSSAKYFGTSPYLAATVAGFMLHPDLIAALEVINDIDFFFIPIQSINYANSVIPIILIVWAQSYIEKFLKRIMPEVLAPVMNPLLTLVITGILGIGVLGPIGTMVGDGIASVLGYFTQTVPWLVPTLMGALSPFVIMGGVHYSLFPAATVSLQELGYETILSPGMLAANMAHAGVALAVALKSKKQAYKSYSFSASVTALMGVAQPALYGIELVLNKPLYAAVIGGGVGGLYAGIFNVKAYAFANPSLPSLPVFLDSGNNIIHAIIMMIISFIVGFVVTWVLGFEEPSDEVVAQTTA